MQFLQIERMNCTPAGVPYSLTDVALLKELYDRDPPGFDSQPILPHLTGLTGVEIGRADQELTVSTADVSSAHHLRLEIGQPVVLVHRDVRDRSQNLIYRAQITYPARHLRISTRLF